MAPLRPKGHLRLLAAAPLGLAEAVEVAWTAAKEQQQSIYSEHDGESECVVAPALFIASRPLSTQLPRGGLIGNLASLYGVRGHSLLRPSIDIRSEDVFVSPKFVEICSTATARTTRAPWCLRGPAWLLLTLNPALARP